MSRGQGREVSQRQLRVGEELRHAIANILERGEIRDPDLANRPVTVTEIKISPDLRNATVFIVPLGGGDPSAVLAGLKRAKGFLRREIAHKVNLRSVPDLSFAADNSFDMAGRIDRILHSPEVMRDLHHEDDGEDEDGREPHGA